MKVPALLTTGSAMLATGVSAIKAANFMHLVPPPLDIADTEFAAKLIQRRDTNSSATMGNGTFQQLLDHSDPSKGTFSQAYWWSTEYWQGPGSPVVFFTPGEVAAAGYTGYLTNRTLTGTLAQEIGGAAVLLEHRYWGESSPFDELTTENMQYLTLENSIYDTTYFANNIKFPFATNASSNADSVPWVFSGGSYSGALAAWVESVDPGTFWAYHASSAVVEVIYDFVSSLSSMSIHEIQSCRRRLTNPCHSGNTSRPCRRACPPTAAQTCPRSLSTSTASCWATTMRRSRPSRRNSASALSSTTMTLPAPWKMGLGSGRGTTLPLTTLTSVCNPPSSFWSLESLRKHIHETLLTAVLTVLFCDSVENVGPLYPNSTVIPGAEGVGLEKALEGYANWVKTELIPGCKLNSFDEKFCRSISLIKPFPQIDCAGYGYDEWSDDYSLGCFDSYNETSPIYTDVTVSNPIDRQWTWMLCNDP